MINLLASLGVPLQSELCVWNMLGLLTTIFDATLFKVNANLKQVWAMEMPSELSLPVQRSLRTIISGIMLVQCFTVYVYLASYIIMLYPIYLEERPALLIPWLLLAAVRKLICELTSLALGLGTCVLVGPARTACVKFVIKKILSLLPSFYMWMLVLSYYNKLKLSNAFINIPIVRPSGSDQDGLELAVRRRRTKSLLDERQLRVKMLQNLASSSSIRNDRTDVNAKSKNVSSINFVHNQSSDTSVVDKNDLTLHLSVASNTEYMEDWFGSEIAMPRDSDRVVAQFNLMLLRIAVFINSGESDTRKFLVSQAKLSFEAEDVNYSTIDESSSRSARTPKKVARVSNAPTVKSDEAVVSMPIGISQDHFLESCNEEQTENSIEEVANIEVSKEKNIRKKGWDRKRKAKSIKLSNIPRNKRFKHTQKVKVSQSILNLIDQCHKKVQENLKVKKDVDYKTYVDIDVGTSNESKLVDQSTNMVSINHESANKTTSTSKLKFNYKIKDDTNKTDMSSISASMESGSRGVKLVEIKLHDKDEDDNQSRRSEDIKYRQHRDEVGSSSREKEQFSVANDSPNPEYNKTIQNTTPSDSFTKLKLERMELNKNSVGEKGTKSQQNACCSSSCKEIDNKENNSQKSLQEKKTVKDSGENNTPTENKDSQGNTDNKSQGSNKSK